MTTASFEVYMEPTGDDVAWWAESSAVPGLTVAAPTLAQLRILIDEAVRLNLGDDTTAWLELVIDVPEPEASPVLILDSPDDMPPLPIGARIRSHTELVGV